MRPMDPDELASLVLAAPAFVRDAACVEHPEIDWFPAKGATTAAAKAVCRGCLVRAECLEYALELDIRDGIWGGCSPGERRAVRLGARPSARSF